MSISASIGLVQLQRTARRSSRTAVKASTTRCAAAALPVATSSLSNTCCAASGPAAVTAGVLLVSLIGYAAQSSPKAFSSPGALLHLANKAAGVAGLGLLAASALPALASSQAALLKNALVILGESCAESCAVRRASARPDNASRDASLPAINVER